MSMQTAVHDWLGNNCTVCIWMEHVHFVQGMISGLCDVLWCLDTRNDLRLHHVWRIIINWCYEVCTCRCIVKQFNSACHISQHQVSHQVWLLQKQSSVTVASVSVTLVLVQQPVGLCGPRVHEERHLVDSVLIKMTLEGVNRVLWQTVPAVQHSWEEVESCVCSTVSFDQFSGVSSPPPVRKTTSELWWLSGG